MRYVLDTAVWANGVLTPAVIPERIRRILGNAKEPKGVCSVSLLECAIHDRRGRLIERPATLDDFFNRALMRDIEILELTPAIAIATNQVPESFPLDPFDRTIAATAKVMNLTLVTTDPEIRDSRICAVEFYPYQPSRIRP